MSRPLAIVGVAALLCGTALVLPRPDHDPTPLTAPVVAEAGFASTGGGSAAGARGFPTSPPVTPEQVRRVVRAGREAQADDLPELRRIAATERDPLVVGNALQALGRLTAVADDPTLLALLADPRPRVRQELVAALGRPGRDAAVPLLARVLAGPDPTLRCLALAALGRVGTDAAQERLRAVLAQPGLAGAEQVFARTALAEAGR